jgi:DNA-binding transcriptional MerR regulator
MTAQFEDGKEDGALRTIGEVSRALGIKTHVLRYWEQQFPMLEPLKRSGGRRYYRTEDVELIETINGLVNGEGYTLKGAQQVLENGGADKSVEQSSDQKTEAVKAGENPISTSTDDSVAPAIDGGVDAFFGKTSEASDLPEAAQEPVAEPEVVAESEPLELNVAEDEGPSREETLVKLKSLRERLAQALAA